MFNLTKKNLATIIFSLVIMNLTTAVIALLIVDRAFKEIEESKTQETLARIGDNRMLRARSNFTLPGFTPTHLERVTRNADTMGVPWWIPAGIAKHENGGDTLEVGMQIIPKDIRLRAPVTEWQYLSLMRMLNQQAWKVILSDPELLSKVLIPFAEKYKSSNPQLWLTETTDEMVDFRSREDVQKNKSISTKTPFQPSKSSMKKKKSTKKFHKKFRINPRLKPENKETSNEENPRSSTDRRYNDVDTSPQGRYDDGGSCYGDFVSFRTA